MIILTRFHSGDRLAINPDLIERLEETPDTVVTMTNGSRYVVQESIADIAERIRVFRASLFNLAVLLSQQPQALVAGQLRLIPGGSSAAESGTGQVTS